MFGYVKIGITKVKRK